MNTILLNRNVYHFSEDSCPILIHGEDHAGSSLFTVSLLADLYQQGSKILFLSGYPMARDEFVKQVGEYQNDNVIFIKGTEHFDFLKSVKELGDIDDRVILIKNIDLFTQEIFDSVSSKNKVIISGNIDKVPYKDHILQKVYKTKIFFSPASFEQVPDLQKWDGYLIGQNKKGTVSLQL